MNKIPFVYENEDVRTANVFAVLEGLNEVNDRLVTDGWDFKKIGRKNLIFKNKRSGFYFKVKKQYSIGDILFLQETFCVDENNNVIYLSPENQGHNDWLDPRSMSFKQSRVKRIITDIIVERVRDIREKHWLLYTGLSQNTEGFFMDYSNGQYPFEFPENSFWSRVAKYKGDYFLEKNPFVYFLKTEEI